MRGGAAMVKLSVVIPVYNVEDYVAKCLDSLLEPGLSLLGSGEEPGYEIIAVNDGSTDSSGEIAAGYARRRPELVKLINIENSGQGQARNIGMEAARGEFLSEALARGNTFKPMLSRMCAVGEASGMLAHTLEEVAAFHERALLVSIRRLSVLIEPVAVGIAAFLVGFVYIAFFLALFSIADLA